MKKLQNFDQFINEAKNRDAIKAYNEVMELDSPAMEEFLDMLSTYFRENAPSLGNMDARKIADHIESAYELIKKRTGN